MAIDIKELTKNKPMKMSKDEVERLVKNYMKNKTLDKVIENLIKQKQPVIIKEFYDYGELLYSAEIEMFPGLVVYEDTVQDAYDELMLAKIDWLNALLED